MLLNSKFLQATAIKLHLSFVKLKSDNKISGTKTIPEKRPLVNIHDIILALEGGIIV